GWDLSVLDADEYPPEDGDTYYENARGKAEYGRRLAGGAWVLGEDSGIEVAGLGGAPGVLSARFGGDDPVGRLLTELRGVEGEGRRARYVSALVAIARRAPAGVHLGAEHDRVRHHVEPDEQQRRAAERPEGDREARQPDVDGQHLKRRFEQDGCDRRAREHLDDRQLHVRQQVVDSGEEDEDGEERNEGREGVGGDAVARERRNPALQEVEA